MPAAPGRKMALLFPKVDCYLLTTGLLAAPETSLQGMLRQRPLPNGAQQSWSRPDKTLLQDFLAPLRAWPLLCQYEVACFVEMACGVQSGEGP